MDFNTLCNIALSSKKYKFDTETYIEENPDFEQPAKYLESIITPISTEQCIDDIINLLKDVIVPIMSHEKKHLYFDVISTSPVKSYEFFGDLAYKYLYENYPYIRKYLHIYIDGKRARANKHMASNTLKMHRHKPYNSFGVAEDFIHEDGIFEHPDRAYCRVDDGTFSGDQFSCELQSGNNIFLCSTGYERATKSIAIYGHMYEYTVNGERPNWVVDHDAHVNYKKLQYNKRGKITPESYKDKYMTVDGEYKLKLNKYKHDYKYNRKLDLYIRNIMPVNEIKDYDKNNVFFIFNAMNSSEYYELYEDGEDYDMYGEDIQRKPKVLSTFSYIDDIVDRTQFYFEHKYPDMMSIVQLPLKMPTYNDGIIDADDINNYKVKDVNLEYTFNHKVSMVTGLKKKINEYTGMVVNDQGTDDLVGFYKYIV